jgi:hypothetical protein
MTWLLDQEPAYRKQIYGQFPPIDLASGMPSPFMGQGPDYMRIAAELPAYFDTLVADYRALVVDELKKQVAVVTNGTKPSPG